MTERGCRNDEGTGPAGLINGGFMGMAPTTCEGVWKRTNFLTPVTP
jgi:hypothetical protein